MIESLSSLLSAKTFPPIILLFGEETFLLEEAYQAILSKASDPAFEQLNLDIVDANDITTERLVELSTAFPMMSERRVVVVKHFEKLNVNKAKQQKNHSFQRYLASPAPTTLLLLLASVPPISGIMNAKKNPKQAKQFTKKRKAAKFPFDILLDNHKWMEFPKLYDSQVPSWVAKRFKKKKVEIKPDACELLIAQTGTSLRDLHNEIEKILTYAEGKKTITRDDINSLIGSSKAYNVFELQRAVGQKKISAAIEIMMKMTEVSKQELLIVSMLTRYFTVLWKLSEAQKKTSNQHEIARVVGISPFFIGEYFSALNHYPQQSIQKAFFALHKADLTLKSTSESTVLVLQKMLIEILS